MLLNDRTQLAAPVIADVPVLHPSGGGYVAHMPLAADDPVMLLFSDRGLEKFKLTYRNSAPDTIMELKDAVAIPGFGPLSQTIPVTDGAYLGTVGGDEYVSVRAGEIKLVGTGRIDVRAPTEILLDGPVRITGDTSAMGTMDIAGETTMGADLDVTGDIDVSGDVDGVRISTHTHLGVQPGGGKTGPPE